MSSACVVGAGVFGASLARELALRDWDVTLVEQYTPGTVRSASGGDTRLLRAAHGDGEWYTASAVRARTLWLELEAATGTRIWERVGLAWFARRADGFEAASVPRPRTPRDRARVARARRRARALPVARRRRPARRALRARRRRAARAARDAAARRGRRAPRRDAAGSAPRPGRRSTRRRRRLGLRRLAAAALSRARRGRGLTPRRLLPRRRPLLARSPRASSTTTAGSTGTATSAGLGVKIAPDSASDTIDPDTLDRLAVAVLGSGGAHLRGAPLPLPRRRTGRRRARVPVRPLGGHALHRRPPPRA